MKTFDSKQLLLIFHYVIFVAVTSLLFAAPSSAQPIELTPGSTTTLEVNSSFTVTDCSEEQNISTDTDPKAFVRFWPPKTVCLADSSADAQLNVFALSGFSDRLLLGGAYSSVQNLSSTANLIRTITIPAPAEGPSLLTLRVQVATEVAWSGGFVVAGFPSTFAQVRVFMQIRDVTDTSSGPVVASEGILSERFDAQFSLPEDINLSGVVEALNLVDAVDVSNSSGADVTAYLERGRTYAIELEAKCEVHAPVFGFGICQFIGGAPSELNLPQENPLAKVFANDGFRVAPFEVTVENDPVAALGQQ